MAGTPEDAMAGAEPAPRSWAPIRTGAIAASDALRRNPDLRAAGVDHGGHGGGALAGGGGAASAIDRHAMVAGSASGATARTGSGSSIRTASAQAKQAASVVVPS
jgi:hypothetical protein